MRTAACSLNACCLGFLLLLHAGAASAEEPPAAPAKLAFTAEASEFRFDTGAFRGSLRTQGKSLGLGPVFESGSEKPLAGLFGILSHYRLLDVDARYGPAAWDWPSEGKLLDDGSVETRWTADDAHPFDMRAVYTWKGPGTLDVSTAVTPKKPLKRFEVFLASYFGGFPESSAYVAACNETGGKPGFLAATKEAAYWHTFPRDAESAALFSDGRWQRPPHPVDWTIRPKLAVPLAMRRDPESGLVALLMSPPSDCFAISMPFGEEGHFSVYLSLFGGDVAAGQTVAARCRLVLGRGITDSRAVALYEEFAKK